MCVPPFLDHITFFVMLNSGQNPLIQKFDVITHPHFSKPVSSTDTVVLQGDVKIPNHWLQPKYCSIKKEQ